MKIEVQLPNWWLNLHYYYYQQYEFKHQFGNSTIKLINLLSSCLSDYRRPRAPASAVNWNGHTVHTHSGFQNKMATMATELTPKIIQSRLRFSAYSSLFSFMCKCFYDAAKVERLLFNQKFFSKKSKRPPKIMTYTVAASKIANNPIPMW